MSNTDLELLSRYARHRAEDAFAELVRRHLGLVHSAALRQVRSPHLAEEVAQATFLKLAQHARQLGPPLILSAWLYQVTRHEAIDVVRREGRRQLREQIATEMNVMNTAADLSRQNPMEADWTSIEPLLDEAMHSLDDTDRSAVLLRYFENKSLREVGETLGTSENAAQKRLVRAIEHLREFFAKRGVTTSTGGLVVLVSANAVLVAPAGLSAAILAATVSMAGAAAVGMGAYLAACVGKLGSPAVAVGLLVLGTVALVVFHRLPGTSQTPVAADASAVTSGTVVATSSDQSAARAVLNRKTLVNATATAVPADTTQRDLALKLYHEGETFQRQKKYDEALAMYNRVEAMIESGLPPERWMADFYFTRATIRHDIRPRSQREYAEEIEDYTKLLRIDPNYSSALANRALAYAHEKLYTEACGDFARLIEDPTVDYSHYIPGRTQGIAWAYEYRGRMWLDAHRPMEAIPDLQKAVALYEKPDEKVYVQFYLASSYKETRQREQLVAEANSMAAQALQWATRPGGSEEEKSAATSGMRWANELLDYKASYQLEVAAAVKAKLGDFEEATKYQERALGTLSPSTEDQREAMQARLETYRARKTLLSP